jgi:hypothetical protein
LARKQRPPIKKEATPNVRGSKTKKSDKKNRQPQNAMD